MSARNGVSLWRSTVEMFFRPPIRIEPLSGMRTVTRACWMRSSGSWMMTGANDEASVVENVGMGSTRSARVGCSSRVM